MAKAPYNLIAYAKALLGWPIEVGSRVITTTMNVGDDEYDSETTIAAGAKAEVIAIDWFQCEQRLSITLEIFKPSEDESGRDGSITAFFDEADPEDVRFAFKPDTSPAE